jgi:hypothetical protein
VHRNMTRMAVCGWLAGWLRRRCCCCCCCVTPYHRITFRCRVVFCCAVLCRVASRHIASYRTVDWMGLFLVVRTPSPLLPSPPLTLLIQSKRDAYSTIPLFPVHRTCMHACMYVCMDWLVGWLMDGWIDR